MKNDSISQYKCSENMTIVDAMGLIDINSSGTLFVVDINDALLGAVTDGDIRRWILKAGDLKAPVKTIMNPNPKYLFMGQENISDSFMKSHCVRVIPIVDEYMRIVDIVNKDYMGINSNDSGEHSLVGTPVIIMAGGKGTRLYPYTKILPKPLIPIGETPIIERIIGKFVEYGINQFYVSVNYKKGMIKAYFNDLKPDYKIEYIEEAMPLGTAGSIKLIKETFDKPIIISNCDTLIMTDYKALYKQHLESKNDITVVSALKNIMVPYGVIHSDSEGKISCLEEKPKLSYFINTGMYVINPSVIRYIPNDKVFHMTDLVDFVIENRGNVGTFPIGEDSFLDMGEVREMKRMEQKLNVVSE